MNFKFGKTPATKDPRDLLFHNYVNLSKIPKPPEYFGDEDVVSEYPMDGNDKYGNCVWAMFAHMCQLFAALGGMPCNFSLEAILKGYSDVTGFDPNDPSTDQGTNERDGLKYMIKTGLVDTTGKIHKFGAFVKIDPKNTLHMNAACWLFGAVPLGVQIPASAMEQFNNNQPWSLVWLNNHIEGGHAIPWVAKRNNDIVLTWGRKQEMTLAWFRRFCDEAYAVLSPEMLKNGISNEGFNFTQLNADLVAL
jgi:hypothetical protein